MSQHDYVINNQPAPAFRSDLNSALGAIVSQNSGAAAPATTFANMLWYDETNNILKIRSEANDAWIPLVTLDQSANTINLPAQRTRLGVYSIGESQTDAQNRANTAQTNAYNSAVSYANGTFVPYSNLMATLGAQGVGGVGTYVLAKALTVTYSPGALISGAGLNPANAAGDFTSSLSGTWRLMGYSINSPTTEDRTSLWLRVS